MSTNVLESENGWASSIAFRTSPWQYNGESHGAVTEPFWYNAVTAAAEVAMTANAFLSEAISNTEAQGHSRQVQAKAS